MTLMPYDYASTVDATDAQREASAPTPSGDRRPPRIAGDERETLIGLLRFQRESFLRKVADLDDATARRPMVPSGTSLLWLTKHVAKAEAIWVLYRFAGVLPQPPNDDVGADDTIATAASHYREICRQVDTVILGASLDDSCPATDDDEPATLRWIVMHLLEEIARHAGHADILRELADGSTGR